MVQTANEQIEWRGYRDGVGAALVWGLAFVALDLCVKSIGPLYTRLISFAFVSLASIPLFFWPQKRSLAFKEIFIKTCVPGIVLGLCLVLQSLGLKYTSIANCGFITVLNVVFLPPAERLIYGRPMAKIQLLAIAIAVAGAAFMSGGLPTNWNVGDMIVMVSAMFGTAHFVVVEKLAKVDASPFLLNATQFIWATLTTAILIPITGEPLPDASHFDGSIFLYLLYLAYGSILIGFSLQIAAQRRLSPTVTGLICLCEAPVAAFAGFLLLHQHLSVQQSLGAILVLAASVLCLVLHQH
jgi:drug/metabolite transporter (DMT)-like permease